MKWVDLKVQEGNSVLRWTRPERNGLGLMTAPDRKLPRARAARSSPTRRSPSCGSSAAASPDLQGRNAKTGEPVTVRSDAVVVATGGFNSNLDMVLEFNPALGNDKVLEGSGRGSTGSGHDLVRQAGGYLTHMDHIWFYVYATPDYRDPAQRRGLVFRLVPGNIWVNQQGRRFHNEALSGGNSATPALMAQSPRHAWAIMDTPMTATMEVADPYYRDGDKVVRGRVVELLNNSPFIRKADTLAELAERMEVDVPAFLATVERYNKACDAAARDRAGVRQAAASVEGVRHAALLRGADLSAGAQELRRRQDRPASAACSTSTSSRSPGSMPRARSPAWPAATSTGAPGSKAPCWVRRSSAGASPAAGRRMRPATAAASSASRTAAEPPAYFRGRLTPSANPLIKPDPCRSYSSFYP